MALIYTLLIGHFIADFMCQSDWMAINKSKRWDALALHVLIYAVVFVLGYLAWFMLVAEGGWRGALPPAPSLFWQWLTVNAVAHFMQDSITSRINARLWFFRMMPGIYVQAPDTAPYRDTRLINPWIAAGGNRHWFFVAIGFDQLLHYVTLFVTAEWWLR